MPAWQDEDEGRYVPSGRRSGSRLAGCRVTPQTVLGLYGLNDFGGGIVVDMLETHPRLMLGGI
jgi:hypothetical protein